MIRIEEEIGTHRLTLYTGRAGARRVFALRLTRETEEWVDMIFDLSAEPDADDIEYEIEVADVGRLTDDEIEKIKRFLTYHAAQL